MRYWFPMILLCCLPLQPLQAQNADAFVVDRAEISLNGDLLLLDLVVETEIPEYILIAIDQGFAVPLMFEVEIRARRDYWLDEKIVTLKQQYRLHYLPLLDSFVVYDVNAAERHYFGERKAAVHFVEVVYNYPMLDIENLAADQAYYARVKFGIDSDELPLPLKSSSLWDNDWELQSDWYEQEVPRAIP